MNRDNSNYGNCGGGDMMGGQYDDAGGPPGIESYSDGRRHHGSDAPGPGKDDDRKLFIGGLSWETTEKDLREYFSKYGEIDNLTLKTDPTSGRSRGFAFVVFLHTVTVDKVMAISDHIINGKKIDPKKAKARTGKVFVGGLSQDISDDDIKNYFSQFGNVVELEMPIDKIKNQRKGFCFVTFDNEQVVFEVLKNPKQRICGKEVDVKKAQPSQTPRGGGMTGYNSMGRGGRGTGSRGMSSRGGYSRGGVSSSFGGGDWYYGASSGYGTPSAYYDYYGGGYGASGYGNYDYGGYGYETSGYDCLGYDSSGRGGSRGGRDTNAAGKQRGGSTTGIQRHVPY